MCNLETVECVVQELNTIRAERSAPLRRALLNKLLRRYTSGEVYRLLNVVLSFQVSEMFVLPNPRFNTLGFDTLEAGIQSWFSTKSLYSVPYIIQSLLYYMQSPRVLGLSVGDIANVIPEFIDPHMWLLDNNVDISSGENIVCPMCNERQSEAGLCRKCEQKLSTFTDFRIESFTLSVNDTTCPWLVGSQMGDEHFEFLHKNFLVRKLDNNKIEYLTTLDGTNGYQPQLPFVEYQRPIT